MSTIKVNNIVPPNVGEGVSIDGLQMPTAGALSNRNLIMNGAMAVSQKSTATGLTNGSSNTYIVDRFGFMESGSPAYQFTYSQDTDVPTGQGFANSLKWLCTTADTTVDANERLRIRQGFEGQNLQQIKKGTANAETLILSFWVKTNLSGDISVVMEDADNSRVISKNATIASEEVDTWVYKTIEFPGDTTGTLDNDNGASIYLEWYVRTGTNYSSGTQATTWAADTLNNKSSSNNIDLGSAVNNYFNLTGVQLEVGSKATPFEYRPIGIELALCQRYYQALSLLWLCQAKAGSNVQFRASGIRPVEMRATPTLTVGSFGALTGTNAIADKSIWRVDASGCGTGNSLASSLTADAEL